MRRRVPGGSVSLATGHLVAEDAHRTALDTLAAAFSKGAQVHFGYMGEGWRALDIAKPCSVTSNALGVYPDDPTRPVRMPIVLSYWSVP